MVSTIDAGGLSRRVSGRRQAEGIKVSWVARFSRTRLFQGGGLSSWGGSCGSLSMVMMDMVVKNEVLNERRLGLEMQINRNVNLELISPHFGNGAVRGRMEISLHI